MSLTGIFAHTIGLRYQAGAVSGTTNENAEFTYQPGEHVTFSIGSLVLGSCLGKSLVTIADLVPTEISDFSPRLVNRARLLFSLTPGQGFEQAIKIDQKVRKVTQCPGLLVFFVISNSFVSP